MVSVPISCDVMRDGSRHFASLPQREDWDVLERHMASLDGAMNVSLVTDGVVEAWIDFDFRRHHFTVNNQLGEYWFFVSDPACHEEFLSLVVEHAARPLAPSGNERT